MKKLKKQRIQNSSFVRQEGRIYEMFYDQARSLTGFVTLVEGRVEYQEAVGDIKPYPIDYDLLKNRVVLFPSAAEDYSSEIEIIGEIRAFIHEFLELSEFMEKIAPYYVLFTWVYDSFKELPYLRAIGDYGCGKSRFLKVVGSLCYKPMFTVGATTTAPIFRLIDQFKGTLILDEADMRFSDTSVDIIKILNNGFQDGLPVLRCVGEDNEIKSFHVFCPKILATRNRFDDKALESRFLIEKLEGRLTRSDIPLNLDDAFEKKAEQIRNKCLMFRLKNFGKKCLVPNAQANSLEPRLSQIINPLCSVIGDEKAKDELVEFIKKHNQELILDRGLSFEAAILETVIELQKMNITNDDLFLQNIATTYNGGLVKGEREVSPRKLGGIIREKFNMRTYRTNRGYMLEKESYQKNIERLCKKYGIESEQVNVVNVPKGSPNEITIGEINF